MKIKGTIKDIVPSMKDGVQRTWEKDGKVFEYWLAFIDVSSFTGDSRTYTDELIAEFSRERLEGNTPLPYKNYIGVKDASIYIKFSRREFNGVHFQSTRMGQVSFTAQ